MDGNMCCKRQIIRKSTFVLFCLFYFHQTIDYGHAKPVQNGGTKKDLVDIKENDLLEGDMIIDQTVWNIITNQTVVKNKRSAVTNGVQLWPGGIVPYIIDIRLGQTARKAINDAMLELTRKTCIKFQARTNEYSYVQFIQGFGCYSYVGRVRGSQSISLGRGCQSKGVALHEMMHALGFFHTSSRTDRDAYVIVYANNVATGYLGNFHKYSHGQIDSFGSPYDITSIMHLPRNAFAKRKGLYTILARAGSQIILGQKVGLSPVDTYQLNALYKCSSKPQVACLTALGLQNKVISDAAMKASSSKKQYNPGQGRLHNSPSSHGNGAWCPSYGDKTPWIQVDLGYTITVTGIATQGLLSFMYPAYVAKYEVKYSQMQHQQWKKYHSWTNIFGNTQDLPGNWDDNSVQYNALTPTFTARYVRIIPRQWIVAPCVRFEIYGCKV